MIENRGKEPAEFLEITDVIPEELLLDTSSFYCFCRDCRSEILVKDNVITWDHGTLAAESSITVGFSAEVPKGDKDSFYIWKNTATVDYSNNPNDDPVESEAVQITGSLNYYIHGKKTISGDRQTVRDQEFSFSIAAGAEGVVLPDECTVKNDADGNFVFGPITFEKAGTYTYRIYEIADKNAEDKNTADKNTADMVYDDTVYYVDVTVGTDPENACKYMVTDVVIHQGKENGPITEELWFENVYRQMKEEPDLISPGDKEDISTEGNEEAVKKSEESGHGERSNSAAKTGDHNRIMGYVLIMMISMLLSIRILLNREKYR